MTEKGGLSTLGGYRQGSGRPLQKDDLDFEPAEAQKLMDSFDKD
jgi:hypothetical protein